MSTTTSPGPGARVRSEERTAGDVLVRIGGVLFAIGAVGTIVTVAPLLLGTHAFPVESYLVAMVMPLGMLVALVGMLVSGVAQRRRSRAAEG